MGPEGEQTGTNSSGWRPSGTTGRLILKSVCRGDTWEATEEEMRVRGGAGERTAGERSNTGHPTPLTPKMQKNGEK
ncbi:hypothetical protein E2C01_077888 [Portunus trituberculatus]|uniref:Uncharacterized protein n=1 Tax=Portunus trituberculatus TaxID=210409 RepID=A0A5B7INC3_PORTR|nr:hypothetical protein [Portunus trituberculatus]